MLTVLDVCFKNHKWLLLNNFIEYFNTVHIETINLLVPVCIREHRPSMTLSDSGNLFHQRTSSVTLIYHRNWKLNLNWWNNLEDFCPQQQEAVVLIHHSLSCAWMGSICRMMHNVSLCTPTVYLKRLQVPTNSKKHLINKAISLFYLATDR